MLLGQLLIQSLRHYWRSHAAASMTAAVCTAILTGALLCGDAVRAGLRQLTALRLGRIQYSLVARDYPFEASLAERMRQAAAVDTAAVLMIDGLLERPDGSLRVNRVVVLGVDDAFFAFSDAAEAVPKSFPAANEALWHRLGQTPQEVILRLRDPSALSQDLIFSAGKNGTPLRISISSAISDAAMGRFGLAANQQSPLNLFVPRDWLAAQLNLAGKANVLLAEDAAQTHSAEKLEQTLKQVLTPEDVGLELNELPQHQMIALTSRQLFIPDAAAKAAMACGQNPLGIFTYFVNRIAHNDRSTPYSMVAGLGDTDDNGLLGTLADNEIILGEWLADDLQAEPGDMLTLHYYPLGDTNELIETQRDFVVRQVVPMMGFAADATLMPAFPGLADADNCTAWDPSIPIDLRLIRDQDEAYWNRYRGTPKAFISLKAAQALWQNRFGNLTAVRWASRDNTIETLRRQLAAALEPAAMGLFFTDVRRQAQQAGAGSTDFAGLFAGLSFFLIAACAMLLSLIFAFVIERRSQQSAILLAMGWTKRRLYGVLLAEGAIAALVGAVLGTAISMFYALTMTAALRTIWQDAVAGALLRFEPNPTTLLTGTVSGFLIAVLAMVAGMSWQLKKTPVELLANISKLSIMRFRVSGRIFRFAFIIMGVVICFLSFLWQKTFLSIEAFFFLNGTLTLLMWVIFIMELMFTVSHLPQATYGFSRLALRNIIRRPGRSLAVFLTVACGMFMTLGVGLNRKSPSRLTERDSGTGGFALWVETALPLSASPDAAYVPLRMRPGDEASCLNLNRAQTPTVLGVDPTAFARREAFSFRSPTEGTWDLLNHPLQTDSIPAIGDYATVYWGLGLTVGNTVAMQDDKGQTIRLCIVAILKESIFQGRLLISERNFIERFPSHDGYRAFLADAEHGQTENIKAELSRRLADYGAEVIPTEALLRDFLRVENTYLSIFLALGGLGLILGSIGAGLVLLFNVLDRRGELAMMQAIGFSRAAIGRLLLAEHAGLFAAGVLAGGLSAMIASMPALIASGDRIWMAGIGLPTAVMLSGAAWVWLAVRCVLAQSPLEGLRNE